MLGCKLEVDLRVFCLTEFDWMRIKGRRGRLRTPPRNLKGVAM